MSWDVLRSRSFFSRLMGPGRGAACARWPLPRWRRCLCEGLGNSPGSMPRTMHRYPRAPVNFPEIPFGVTWHAQVIWPVAAMAGSSDPVSFNANGRQQGQPVDIHWSYWSIWPFINWKRSSAAILVWIWSKGAREPTRLGPLDLWPYYFFGSRWPLQYRHWQT